jgi:2-furoyl-CoA dehydrogenase FAD binding subunit
MKPARFDYMRAHSADDVLHTLDQAGTDARVLAGGQSLLPMLNMRLARPLVVVDIMGVPEWQRIDDDGRALRIAAAVRQMSLERHPGLADRQPLLATALPFVGHAQTRTRGTVCGSIAHADPSAELPLVLLALRGWVHLRSRRRRRDVSVETFFNGTMATACADNEVIEAVSFPTACPGTGYAFREVARRSGDFAIVACAAVADATGVRLAVGGVADRPRAVDLPVDPAAFADALEAFAWELDARDDIHATARYRRELVRHIGRQVALKAQADAETETGPRTPLRGGKRVEKPDKGSCRRLPPPPSRKGRGSSGMGARTISFTLNARPVSVDAEPRILLVDILRHALGATGTHVGCEHGVCGACTVQIDGEPARSCIMLAVQAAGADVRTVESLAPEPGRLSVLQECFRDHYALQCGFCTPGILMSLDALLRMHPDATEQEIRTTLGGHLCRCTGYAPIMRAALAAQQRLRDLRRRSEYA